MNCEEVCEFLDAYVDNELDAKSSSQFARHLNECAACREQHDRYAEMRRAVRTKMEYFHAPEGFEQQLRARLFLAHEEEQTSARKQSSATDWRVWAMAAGLVAVMLSTVVLVQMLRRGSTSEMVAQQVVSSHIRSLLASHLSDVISTDQHTVKPWFSGKLDFAPVVKDLSSKGFPLIGGRLDYLNDRAVAALVYKRRQHTINLFLWPSQDSDSGPQSSAIRGYNLVHWTHSHMTYWAVSDVNAGDLREFTHDLEN